MARIAGVNIPSAKRVVIALTYIHGIGRVKSEEILVKAEIKEDTKRVSDLTGPKFRACAKSSTPITRWKATCVAEPA